MGKKIRTVFAGCHAVMFWNSLTIAWQNIKVSNADKISMGLRKLMLHRHVNKIYIRIVINKASRNGRVVKCAVLWHGRSWVQALAQAIGLSHGSDLHTTNACGYVWRLQVHGSKELGYHAGHQEVSRCCTRGESEEYSMQTRKHASESTLALKPGTGVTSSPKQGYQWSHKKDMCPPKILKRKEKKRNVIN